MKIKIHERRTKAALTQSQLAQRTGFSRQTIGDLESGTSMPNVTTAIRISKVLGCKVEDLYEEDPGDAGENHGLILAGSASEARPAPAEVNE